MGNTKPKPAGLARDQSRSDEKAGIRSIRAARDRREGDRVAWHFSVRHLRRKTDSRKLAARLAEEQQVLRPPRPGDMHADRRKVDLERACVARLRVRIEPEADSPGVGLDQSDGFAFATGR